MLGVVFLLFPIVTTLLVTLEEEALKISRVHLPNLTPAPPLPNSNHQLNEISTTVGKRCNVVLNILQFICSWLKIFVDFFLAYKVIKMSFHKIKAIPGTKQFNNP